MKVLQIIDKLDVGGAEKVFVDMCTVLNKNNEKVAVLFLLEGGELAQYLNPTIPIKALKRYNKWSLFKMYECYSELKKHDLLHCHSRHVYRYIKLVALLTRLQTTIVFQDHFSNKKFPLFFNSIFKPKIYVAVSKDLIRLAHKALSIPKKKCFLLKNIIIKEPMADAIIPPKFDLILVSNIKPAKKQLFAIQLAQQLKQSLQIVGKTQDETYFKLLKQQIGSDQNIEFSQNQNKVQPILAAAKIGLHVSEFESGPLVLMEYLAQGLPFLAFDTGEVARIIKAHYPDFFIATYELSAWEERLYKIAHTHYDTTEMQAIFNYHFGEEDYYEKIMTIYRCTKN